MALSKKEIRRAGEALAKNNQSNTGYEENLSLIKEWRSAHIEPLQVMFYRLEEVAHQNNDFVITSRLKRAETIIDKLNRLAFSHPNVTTMGDIAGCRLIVPNKNEVDSSIKQLLEYGDAEKEKIRDYINGPKESGYRGIHLYNKIDAPLAGYSGLHVETQVRTIMQHSWAVAVEMYDKGTNSRLKFGEGEVGARIFFVKAAELLAAKEKSTDKQNLYQSALVDELQSLEKEFHVIDVLKAVNDSMFSLDAVELEMQDERAFFLIRSDFETQQSSLTAFTEDHALDAAAHYYEAEAKKGSLEDVLLAKASSISALKVALPNYFANATQFLSVLSECGIGMRY